MAKLGQLFFNLLRKNPVIKIPSRYRQFYTRKVIGTFKNEEEYTEHLDQEKLDEKREKTLKQKKELKNLNREDPPNNEKTDFDMYRDVPKDILNLKFETPNPAKIGSFSKMMLNMKSRAYRERHGTCMLEGKFLISDAMKSGMFVRLIYFSRLTNLIGLPVDVLKKTNLIKVGFEEIRGVSEVKVQSEGLLAIATKQDDVTRKKLTKWRNELAEQNKQDILPLTLLCDNIRDAGNMGALLRTAAAVGCYQVITTKGCVDIWDPKVIRAGAGAHFKIPILPSLNWDEIQEKMEEKRVKNVYLTHPQSRSVKISDIIPNIETRNALHEKLSSSSHIPVENYEDDINNKMIGDVTMCSLPYYDVPFTDDDHTVLVLGSEVHGTSSDAYLYSIETSIRNGERLKKLYNIIYIPMMFGSECLNTSVAGSILLYEARRQISN